MLVTRDELNIRKKLTKLTSKEFLATVIDNQDPLKSKRVKIRISLVHRNIPDSKLPWASPASTESSNSNYGSFNLPVIGSFVYVKFLDESGFNLTYKNTCTTESLPNLFTQNYGNVYGIVDEIGNIIKVDKKSNNISVEHNSGSSIIFERDGSVSINCKNLKINSTGDTNIVSSNITQEATKISLNTTNLEENSDTYKNVSNTSTISTNTLQMSALTSINIQSLAELLISSLLTNITGSTLLNLSGTQTNINGVSGTSINSAALLVNATNTVTVDTETEQGMILPGSPQINPITPPTITPEIPIQPQEPKNLKPLPKPEIPNVKNMVNY